MGKSENPTRLAVVQIGSVKKVGYLVPLHLEGGKRLIGSVVRNGDNPIGSHGRYTVDEQTPEVTAWLFASRELAEWKLGTLQAATNWGGPVQRPLIHL